MLVAGEWMSDDNKSPLRHRGVHSLSPVKTAQNAILIFYKEKNVQKSSTRTTGTPGRRGTASGVQKGADDGRPTAEQSRRCSRIALSTGTTSNVAGLNVFIWPMSNLLGEKRGTRESTRRCGSERAALHRRPVFFSSFFLCGIRDTNPIVLCRDSGLSPRRPKSWLVQARCKLITHARSSHGLNL